MNQIFQLPPSTHPFIQKVRVRVRFQWHRKPLRSVRMPQTRDFSQEVFRVCTPKYMIISNNFVYKHIPWEFNRFLFFLPNTHFAVTTAMGLAIGAVLALLFCGMSCVFMKIKRKKDVGKDNSKIANGENNKNLQKTGITYQKPIYRVLFYHLPEFHKKYIIFKLT